MKKQKLCLYDYANRDVMKLILSKFFTWTYSNFKTLLKCRLVCKEWKNIIDRGPWNIHERIEIMAWGKNNMEVIKKFLHMKPRQILHFFYIFAVEILLSSHKLINTTLSSEIRGIHQGERIVVKIPQIYTNSYYVVWIDNHEVIIYTELDKNCVADAVIAAALKNAGKDFFFNKKL